MLKHKKIKKMETSKILILTNYVLALTVLIYTFILCWKTNDTSPLQVLIPAVFAEVTAATGFYYWKAKHENLIKISRSGIFKQTQKGFQNIQNQIDQLQKGFQDNR